MSSASQKKHTGLLEALTEGLDEKNAKMSTNSTRDASSPSESQLGSEGRKLRPKFLCNLSGAYLDRRLRHVTLSVHRKQECQLQLHVPCGTMLPLG